jgi:hypothetical protein
MIVGVEKKKKNFGLYYRLMFKIRFIKKKNKLKDWMNENIINKIYIYNFL